MKTAIVNIATIVTGDWRKPFAKGDSILMDKGRIKKVGTLSAKEINACDVVVDANRTTACPGLIDSQVHITFGDYTPRQKTVGFIESYLHGGVTSCLSASEVQFKDAALILKVTPQITASNTVIMKIALENGQADFTKAVNGIPPINTQSANTSVQVNDGQTTVIGGIYLSTEQYQTDRTPGLGRIPLLNWLFKRDNALDNSSELLIFITPRIIKS